MASPLVELQLETAAFAGDWNHCDHVANYLAQLVSHDRPDSFLYANLLSTVLNELLEVIFARHAPRGAVTCTLSRENGADLLDFTVPVDEADRAYYQASAAGAKSADVAETYTRTLLGGDVSEAALGFLELAADYGARISVAESAAPGEISLRVQIRLADGGLPASAGPAL